MAKVLVSCVLILALTACGGGGGGDDDEAIVVTTLADAGEGSLRAALAAVPEGGTILFEEGLEGTITLTTGTLVVARSMNLQGPGASRITVSGAEQVRVFDVLAGLEVSVEDITIQGGTSVSSGAGMRTGAGFLLLRRVAFSKCVVTGAGRGGGLHVPGGIARLEDCTFANCEALNGGGVAFDTCVATMRRCTIHTCQANAVGGGVLVASGAEFHGLNCTISGNTAASSTGGGAGLGIFSASSGGPTTATVSGCTITLNITLGPGGGIALRKSSTFDEEAMETVPVPALLTIKNSIVGDNTASAGSPDIDRDGSLITLGYNVIGDGAGSGMFDGINDDRVGDPGMPLFLFLGALAENGGSTMTHMPLPGCPAIDFVPVASFTNRLDQLVDNDQRGVLRPVGGACDAGAVERDE